MRLATVWVAWLFLGCGPGIVKGSARPFSDCPNLQMSVKAEGEAVAIDDQGAFEVLLQSGRRSLEFSYLDWSARSEVEVGPSTTVLEAPVPPRTGALHGRVLRSPAPPPAGAGVALRGTCVAMTTTDATGGYAFPSLPSGDYAVVSERPESSFRTRPLSYSLDYAERQATFVPGVTQDVDVAVPDIEWQPIVIVRGRVLRAGAPWVTSVCAWPSLVEDVHATNFSVRTGTDGRYEIRAPLSVTKIENCDLGGPQASVSLTAPAVFGQVSEAPDLIIP